MRTKLIIFILLVSNCLFSQDLIVTKNNDSIFCKINSIRNEVIRFSINNNEQESDSTLLLSDTRRHVYNYKVNKRAFNAHKFEISLHRGLSTIFGNINLPSNFPPFPINRTSSNSDLEFNYFFNNNWGIGIQSIGVSNSYYQIINSESYNYIKSYDSSLGLNELSCSYRKFSTNFRHQFTVTYGTGIAVNISSGSFNTIDLSDFLAQNNIGFYSMNTLWSNSIQARYNYYPINWLSLAAKIRYDSAIGNYKSDSYGIYAKSNNNTHYSALDFSIGVGFHF